MIQGTNVTITARMEKKSAARVKAVKAKNVIIKFTQKCCIQLIFVKTLPQGQSSNSYKWKAAPPI